MSMDRTGSGGALEAVEEESRIQTAVSDMTKRQMSMDSAFQLDDLEAAIAAEKEEERDVFVVDWDDVLLGFPDALDFSRTEPTLSSRSGCRGASGSSGTRRGTWEAGTAAPLAHSFAARYHDQRGAVSGM